MILLARRAELLEKAVNEAKSVSKGSKVVGLQFDVSDKAQVASLFDRLPADLRDIDILGTLVTLSKS